MANLMGLHEQGLFRNKVYKKKGFVWPKGSVPKLWPFDSSNERKQAHIYHEKYIDNKIQGSSKDKDSWRCIGYE